MIKKIFGYSAITASVITGCYAFASPWIALRDLTQAFKDQDTRKIEKLVDFPELREDIKITAKAAVTKSAAIELEGNPFAAMGIMMANAIVDPIIDQVISPAGLQLFFFDREMSIGTDEASKDIGSIAKHLIFVGDSSDTNREMDVVQSIQVKSEYVGINEFEVQVSDSDIPNESVSFYMRRKGLGDWKVNGIRLPNSLVERLMDN
ncbi:DUF2939 domain-containing protein [Synechococcus sp. MU1642]|uniref:DUF2939 domain-containing protein n=1 Tax=Synechococcus sp. MU1642 TaxID=2508348 RepID=UPI001CF84834|nr:DUF2939 domain-containing protein [Synechococcus sp. MU1642]